MSRNLTPPFLEGTPEILTEFEEHVDWLETRLFRIEKVGIQNYLAEQMGGHDG